MEPRAPAWRSRLTWMSARTAMGVVPGKRTGACVVRQPHWQPQDAVPEAVAETPVTRYVLSPRGSPWSSAGDRRVEPRSVVRSAESGSTKVPSQDHYKPLSPACTRTPEYLGPEIKNPRRRITSQRGRYRINCNRVELGDVASAHRESASLRPGVLGRTADE